MNNILHLEYLVRWLRMSRKRSHVKAPSVAHRPIVIAPSMQEGGDDDVEILRVEAKKFRKEDGICHLFKLFFVLSHHSLSPPLKCWSKRKFNLIWYGPERSAAKEG